MAERVVENVFCHMHAAGGCWRLERLGGRWVLGWMGTDGCCGDREQLECLCVCVCACVSETGGCCWGQEGSCVEHFLETAFVFPQSA